MRFPWLFATILVQFLVKTESKKLLFVKYNNSVSRSGSIRRLRPSDFPTGITFFRQTTFRGPVGRRLPPPAPRLATPLDLAKAMACLPISLVTRLLLLWLFLLYRFSNKRRPQPGKDSPEVMGLLKTSKCCQPLISLWTQLMWTQLMSCERNFFVQQEQTCVVFKTADNGWL